MFLVLESSYCTLYTTASLSGVLDHGVGKVDLSQTKNGFLIFWGGSTKYQLLSLASKHTSLSPYAP